MPKEQHTIEASAFHCFQIKTAIADCDTKTLFAITQFVLQENGQTEPQTSFATQYKVGGDSKLLHRYHLGDAIEDYNLLP